MSSRTRCCAYTLSTRSPMYPERMRSSLALGWRKMLLSQLTEPPARSISGRSGSVASFAAGTLSTSTSRRSSFSGGAASSGGGTCAAAAPARAQASATRRLDETGASRKKRPRLGSWRRILPPPEPSPPNGWIVSLSVVFDRQRSPRRDGARRYLRRRAAHGSMTRKRQLAPTSYGRRPRLGIWIQGI
jgi:hypothetical protein